MVVKQKTKAELIEENKKLLEQVKITESMATSPVTNRYLDEMRKIKQKGRVDSTTIKVQEIVDHKNISLWTKDGKRIGPLHQRNALAALDRFYAMGVELSADQPTAKDIEAYKKTKEYKLKMELLKNSRDIKEKSRRKGTMEKYLKEIASLTGQTVDALSNIVKPENVKSLQVGRQESGV